MVRVVAFANAHGYRFTIEEAKQVANQKVRDRYDDERLPTEYNLERATGVFLLTDGMLYGLGRLDFLDDPW
jgi:hypothetical protein